MYRGLMFEKGIDYPNLYQEEIGVLNVGASPSRIGID